MAGVNSRNGSVSWVPSSLATACLGWQTLPGWQVTDGKVRRHGNVICLPSLVSSCQSAIQGHHPHFCTGRREGQMVHLGQLGMTEVQATYKGTLHQMVKLFTNDCTKDSWIWKIQIEKGWFALREHASRGLHFCVEVAIWICEIMSSGRHCPYIGSVCVLWGATHCGP